MRTIGWKAVSCIVGILIAVVCVSMWRSYEQSPEAIRDKAVRAMEHMAGNALYDLTSKAERDCNALDETKLNALLNASGLNISSGHTMQSPRFEQLADGPSDRRCWLIRWEGDPPRSSRLLMTVFYYKGEGWRLHATGLLYSLYIRRTIEETKEWQPDDKTMSVARRRFVYQLNRSSITDHLDGMGVCKSPDEPQ